MKEYYFDTRLQEKMLFDNRLTRQQLSDQLATLEDVSGKAVEYDEEGNPTNIPERELKTLPIKPGEPEPVVEDEFELTDPLSEAWGTGPQ